MRKGEYEEESIKSVERTLTSETNSVKDLGRNLHETKTKNKNSDRYEIHKSGNPTTYSNGNFALGCIYPTL